MKRTFIAAVALAATTLLSIPSGASAQSTATVSLMHGIPGTAVDVVVDGAVVVPNFQPGTMQDISSFAGQTLENVEVRAAGTDTVVIGPVAELAVPASGNWTVLAHLTADGTPTLTPFENDTSTLPAGQGRLVVRHTAAAPAVDIVLADGSRPFTNLSNPNEASAALPAGEIAGAKVAPAGGAPIADVPTVELQAGTDLIVYAVGSLEGGSFTFYTQTITGLGGSPTLVNTGDSLPGSSGSGVAVLLAAAAGVLALTGTGLLVARRRSN
ncbi:MAG: DUF4397 domain-containing protein [Ilumatobacteraceae bacterium]